MFYVYVNNLAYAHRFSANTLEEAKQCAEENLMFYTIRDGLGFAAAIVFEKQFENGFKAL